MLNVVRNLGWNLLLTGRDEREVVKPGRALARAHTPAPSSTFSASLTRSLPDMS
jgi:hypothetical protein